MNYIYDIHQSMIKYHLILAYEGDFSQEISKAVLSMAERNMEFSNESTNIRKKVFNVMVECLQNICKHASVIEEIPAEIRSAIFIVGKTDDEYFIASGNTIHQDEVAGMKERLEEINRLDRKQLRQLYRETLESAELSEKGGAGLGLIDMARKSGNKLEYSFDSKLEGYSFFSLRTIISRK